MLAAVLLSVGAEPVASALSPTSNALPKWQRIRGETEEMLKWWCDEEKGHEEELRCVKRKMKDASLEERKEWRKKMAESAHNKDAVDESDIMTQAYCATHEEALVCKQWAEREKMLSRTGHKIAETLEHQKMEKAAEKPAEFQKMLAAWCTGEHYDDSPCIKKRIEEMRAAGQEDTGPLKARVLQKGQDEHAEELERMCASNQAPFCPTHLRPT